MKSISLLFIGILFVSGCKSVKKSAETIEAERATKLLEKAMAIHERVITIDTHCDINVDNFTDGKNYTQKLENQVNLPKMIEGGLDVPWFIVYTGQSDLDDAGYEKAYENAISKFDAIHKLCEEFAPDQIELALTSDDVRRISAKGKKAAMIGVENAYPIGLNMENFELFHKLGARYISLSHNGHSQFCDSNTGEAEDEWLHGGLSELGKHAIVEMNRLGIMIDVSHPAKTSIMQMLELTKAPLIASHSSARAMCDHSRNLDDEQLKAIAKNGGVVQTVAFTSYLNTEKYETRNNAMEVMYKQLAESKGEKWLSREEAMALDEKNRSEYWNFYQSIVREVREKAKNNPNLPPPVDVGDLVNHIDYMVDLIGIDHVGISSDFDGGGGIGDWKDASETHNVTIELVKRGYTEAQIEKLWGGNLLRVLDKVQAVAANWSE